MIKELVDPWSLKGRIYNYQENIIFRIKKIMQVLKHPDKIMKYIRKKSQNIANRNAFKNYPLPITDYIEGNQELVFQKRALITYVASSFYDDPYIIKVGHANKYQALEIAKAFNRLGYIVDFVDYMDSDFIPSRKYDVFFGMHYNFGRFLPYLNKSTKTIYYGTGTYWSYEIAKEQERICDLKARRGVEFSLPIRLGENNWTEVADGVIVMGNRFNLDTYLLHRNKGNIYSLDNTAIPTLSIGDLSKKDFSKAKYNFLWFGSSGLLHKGLDLVLEAFMKVEDAHLWVCGPLESKNEHEFLNIYRKELFYTPNIHPVGWVDVYSDKFDQLINMCASVILVSCSEANVGGILNCMKSGLIPILSKECTTDTEDFGITLENNSIDEIINSINVIKNEKPEKCYKMANKAIFVAETRYSLKQFRNNIESVLKKEISHWEPDI
jgi:glycosyltransferase involved in cell wall biosynthesis